MPDEPQGQGQQQGDPQGTPPQQGQPQPSGQPVSGQQGQPQPADPTDWKAEARKWEDRAKSNDAARKELDKIRAAQQTAEERAQETAKQAEARAAAATRRVASAEIRAALTGVVPDPGAVVEDLDLSRFIDADSGEVKADAVTALKAKYAALAPPAGPRAPAPNPAQGTGGTPPPTLGEIIGRLEAKPDRSRAETAELMRAKSRMALGTTKQG